MSGANQHRAPIADEVDFEAAQWIERRDCTEWTEVDEAGFNIWIDTSPYHRVAFLRLDSGWKNTERLAALRTEPQGFLRAPERFIAITKRGVAALGVIAVIAAAVVYYTFAPSYQSYATGVGGRASFTLADGSRIEMNTDTVVRILMRSDRRKILLEKGEAYFDVVHDSAHPFTVIAGDGRITDLGTKFSVRREADHLEVALYEGRARVAELGAHAATLTPGDVVTASSTFFSVKHKSGMDISKNLSWRRGVLVFDDTPLAEAARELNRYNDTKILITDPAVGRVGMGGTFATNNVAGFARVAKNLLHLQVENRGDVIVISR
jgi:transmembrane sensor